jgi:hypothetical protein
MGLFKFWFYIQNTKKIMKNKTYMINHIPIKQMWLEENIILIKYVQKWVDQTLLKTPMEKKIIIYQRTKIQKLGNPKNERVQKNLANYIKWKTLNHIIIYNPLFSSLNRYCIYSLFCMMTSV